MAYINPYNLVPGEVVTLHLKFSDEPKYNARSKKVRAQVVAKYPHHVQFRMAAGYMQCFRYWDLVRILNRKEGET